MQKQGAQFAVKFERKSFKKYVRSKLSIFDLTRWPALFLFVLHVPPSTYVRFSQLPSPPPLSKNVRDICNSLWKASLISNVKNVAYLSMLNKLKINKINKHSSIIWPIWLNGWEFVYELSGCGFGCRCCHINSMDSCKLQLEKYLKMTFASPSKNSAR